MKISIIILKYVKYFNFKITNINEKMILSLILSDIIKVDYYYYSFFI